VSGYLNTITPAIFVRNIRRRPDRLEHMQQQMKKINTDYLVFDCADDKGTQMSAMWWNAQNSLQVIRYSKEAGLDSVLLLDDDCLFVDDFNEKLESLWPHMPEDWDIVSFGEIYGTYTDIYPGIVRTTYSWGGHASLVRNTMYDKLLNTLTGFVWADEEMNQKLKPSIKFYAFRPYLVTQMPGYSDLAHRHKDNREFQ
jgi:hypothetical protein